MSPAKLPLGEALKYIAKYWDGLCLFLLDGGVELDSYAVERATITYLYDFGDNWEHRLRIGRATDPVPGELYPRLTDIPGRCPPEDVGGFPGYQEFLQAMADPKHPEHMHLKEWCGEDFEPNTPPADEFRREVLKLAKRWKPRKLKG